MADALAIDGDYADLKLVKTRSVMQMIIEIPIERGEELVRMFGVPQPGKPVRLAVARIAEKAAPVPAPKAEKRRFDELPASQQAALVAEDPRFWKFLNERHQERGGALVNSEGWATNFIRNFCGVASRSELTSDPAANALWQSLRSEYEAWKLL